MGASFESSGNGGGAFYSFLGFIKNVRADVNNNSVIPMRVPVVQHGMVAGQGND